VILMVVRVCCAHCKRYVSVMKGEYLDLQCGLVFVCKKCSPYYA